MGVLRKAIISDNENEKLNAFVSTITKIKSKVYYKTLFSFFNISTIVIKIIKGFISYKNSKVLNYNKIGLTKRIWLERSNNNVSET